MGGCRRCDKPEVLVIHPGGYQGPGPWIYGVRKTEPNERRGRCSLRHSHPQSCQSKSSNCRWWRAQHFPRTDQRTDACATCVRMIDYKNCRYRSALRRSAQKTACRKTHRRGPSFVLVDVAAVRRTDAPDCNRSCCCTNGEYTHLGLALRAHERSHKRRGAIESCLHQRAPRPADHIPDDKASVSMANTRSRRACRRLPKIYPPVVYMAWPLKLVLSWSATPAVERSAGLPTFCS